VDPSTPGSQYDEFAAEFEAHALESAYNAYYDRPAVLDLLGDVGGKRVLDAGCGPGIYAEELTARGADVVCFDQSREMVRLARERLGTGTPVHLHDLANPLDWLSDGTFDAAVMALVLPHLDEPELALRELHRILRSQGRLVVSTVHPVFYWKIHGGSYFTEEVVEEAFLSRGWRVRSRRAPLERWCADFWAAGFVIERLLEPRPIKAMAERYPDEFVKLSREPGFLTFRLSKAP
jgi:ubiquinone/menaquinone biosynthesis C-methylase UbiE